LKRYVDTSVLVGFVVNEVHTERIRLQMKEAGSQNVISDWTATEFYAALAFKLRTDQITPAVKQEAESFFETARNTLFATVAVRRMDFRRAAVLGSRFELGLRAGDALHLAIAQSIGATLWTVDHRLKAAAEKAGTPVEPG